MIENVIDNSLPAIIERKMMSAREKHQYPITIYEEFERDVDIWREAYDSLMIETDDDN